MSSKLKIFLLSCLAFIFVSCGEENIDAEIVTYGDFLWSEYTPEKIPMGTVKVEFEDDAVPSEEGVYETGFWIAVYDVAENGEKTLVDPAVAQIYYNDEPSEDNKCHITNKNGNIDVKVSAAMNNDAEDRTYKFSVELMEEGQEFEKLILGGKSYQVSKDNEYANHNVAEFSIDKGSKMNPLKKWLLIILIVFIALNLFWLVVMRPIYFKRFAIRKISIVGPEPYMQNVPVSGRSGSYIKVVLTRKSQKQGFFNKLYTGEIKYIVNEIWTEDVELIPRDRRSIRVRAVNPRGVFVVDSPTLMKDNECKLTNTETKGITKITIN